MEIHGENIAAGLSGQKFERSQVCIREYILLRCALGGGRSVPEPARLSNTQHQEACSRGGFGGGGFIPPGTAAVSKHETGTVTKQTTGAVSKHETGTVTKQTSGAVSTHETGTMTKQTTGAVFTHETGTVTKQTIGAVSTHETGTVVSKHETCTVTKQTTGAVSTH